LPKVESECKTIKPVTRELLRTGKVTAVESQSTLPRQQEPEQLTGTTNPDGSKRLSHSNDNGTGSGGCDGNTLEGTGDASFFGSVDTMPSFIEAYRPPYPEAARLSGIEGKVFVKVLVDERGHAIKAMIAKRQPADCQLFDTAALSAATLSRYSPGVVNGRPVKVWCLIPINFHLDQL
jgi:protein TonB